MPRRPYGLSGRLLHPLRSLIVTTSLLALLVTPGLVASAVAQDVVSGRVVDTGQRAVGSARVLILSGATVVRSILTREDGTFGPVPIAAGRYDVLVSAPGLRGAPRAIDVRGATTLDVLVVSPAAVSESVVVSAAQVDTPLSRITDSVTVLDRAYLDARQVETVADAVRLAPGFGVVASGGRGAVTSFFPRGGESDYTRVMADGIPLNTFGGGFDAAHLPTADLERVEIVRGPQSAVFGSGAIGGVIQLITRHGGPLSARALLESGGYGTRRGSVSAAGSAAALSWSGAVEGLSSTGDARDYPAFGGRIANDDYARWDGSGGLGWTPRPDAHLRGHVRHGRNERGFPGPYGSDPDNLFGAIDESRGENRTTGVSLSGALGSVASMRQSGRVTWFETRGHYTSFFGGFPSESDNDTRRTTGRYQIDLERRLAGVSAGVEFLAERNDNTYITGVAFQQVPVERSNTGLFVESRWGRGGRGSLTAGVRLERIERRALEADPGAFNNRPAFDDDVVWSANPKVSAVWFLQAPTAAEPGRWTRLRAGAGTGIKAPTGFDIAFTDNPALKPERSRSVDLGVEQALAGASVLIDATWFFNRYDDLIVTVGSGFTGASRYRTDNVANARARGVELGLTWRGPHGLRARGALTLLDTEVLAVDDTEDAAPTPFEVGQALHRRAPRQGALELHWTSTRVSLFGLVNGRSAMLDLEPNFASSVYDNPGHVVLTVGGRVVVWRSLEVFGRITNALDRTYEDVLGYPAPGRVAFVGFRASAGR